MIVFFQRIQRKNRSLFYFFFIVPMKSFAFLLLCTIALAYSLDDVYTHLPETTETNWIWTKDTTRRNQWSAFRKEFSVQNKSGSYTMNIAVDSKYWLWINDQLVVFEGELKRGPNPTDGFYDSVDITQYLVEGRNIIAVQVWYFGKDSFNHIGSGSAGLLVDIPELKIKTDESWKCMELESYQPEIMEPNMRLPEGNIVYNATLSIPNWYTVAYNDNQWSNANVLCHYPCAPFNLLWKRPFALFKYGDITKKTGEEIKKIGTKTIQNMADEYHVNVDTEYVVYQITLPVNVHFTPYLSIRSPSSNLYIFMDPDNKYVSNELCHYSTYITKEGEQEYESLGWLNGHYPNFVMPESIEIHSLGWRESGYNSEFVGSFHSDDEFYNTLWMKSRHTLYVTIRDNYMDCPDRERTYWTGDQVNESLMSYYVFDKNIYDAIRKGILLVQEWHNEEGVIPTIAPSKEWFELPSQSLAGIIGSYSYYYYSGDLSVLKHNYPVTKIYVLESYSMNESGLMNYRPGSWDWLDWGDNIDNVCLLNEWYYYALDVMIKIATVTGHEEDVQLYKERKDSISNVFIKTFWNEEKQAIYSPGYTGDIDDRANAMAIITGLLDSSYYPSIRTILDTHTHASPYMEKYVEEALYMMHEPELALKRMKNRYQEMVDYNYSTLWELWDINSGTKNHAWSGGPLYLLSRYNGGIYPTDVQYETYAIEPVMSLFKNVSIVVPTIKGTIHLSGQMDEQRSHYEIIGLKETKGKVVLEMPCSTMSKLRINSFELNINTATEEEIHKFEKNTSIHYIGAVEKTIQFEIFTDSKLEVDLE